MNQKHSKREKRKRKVDNLFETSHTMQSKDKAMSKNEQTNGFEYIQKVGILNLCANCLEDKYNNFFRGKLWCV